MSEHYSLGALAQHLGAEVVGDSRLTITGIASILSAKPGEITFLTEQRHRQKFDACQASAVILTAADLPYWQRSALIVTNPYLSYARLARLLDTTPRPKPGIASSAVLADGVRIGTGVTIGDHTVIEAGVQIGDGSIIGAHCFIGENVQIGCNTRLWMQVSIYHAVIIGNNCLIHAGTVIGSDGFGYANDRGEWVKIPQLGTVLIGNNVEIGACTTIDRGALDNTMIGDGVIIDNQCQIAHNVIIGNHTAVAGGVIMAGGLKIGCYCKIGGASVINGHMEICDRVTITGMAMVMRPITKAGVYSSGIPQQPNATWRKTAANLLRINEMAQRVSALERTIKQLQITSVP